MFNHIVFLGFGLACLPGIDPKPENLVGTGIIKTATTQIGCLLRLEPSQELQVQNFFAYQVHVYVSIEAVSIWHVFVDDFLVSFISSKCFQCENF